MQQYDDISLIQRLQINDVAAFDIFYKKYHIAVYNNVLKLTRNSTITEDIVQETFIKLWEKRSTIDTAKNISGWLFVISHNLTIDYLRKQIKETAREVLPEDVSYHTDEELKATEKQWQVLEDAIALLSPQKKKVFELCKLQGKTYEQAANELGISKHTIKEYLSEAVAFIKKYVQENQMLQIIAGSVFFLEIFLS